MFSNATASARNDQDVTVRSSSRVFILTLLAMLFLVSAQPTHAQTESILYNFTGLTGPGPRTNLAIDNDGNLYGTNSFWGGGTVYKVTPSGGYTLLHQFQQNYVDGYWPMAGVILDQQGNVYGTTLEGGNYDAGIIFEISPTGTETILHSFDCYTEGCNPQAGLVMDSEGNLYGTTVSGAPSNYGTVFKFVPSSGMMTALYNFTGGSDGCYPWGVVLDSAGNLYGTTQGGCLDLFGLVFKVTPSGAETVLHSFKRNGKDGFSPESSVIIDSKGNLYGTTGLGGSHGLGAVYKVTPAGKETILHSFKGEADGIFPQASLAFDSSANLYGTTLYGGTLDWGTVFKIVKTRETTLHSFELNGTDGVFPYGGVIFNPAGNLYGTTSLGGNGANCGSSGCGTIFKITPQTLAEDSGQDAN